MINSWEDCVEIISIYVNPETKEVSDTNSENTLFQVWLEAGPQADISQQSWPSSPEGWTNANKWVPSHDPRLDVGADTLEEALLRLAARVKTFYQEDGTDTGLFWCKDDTCETAEDGFCKKCGFSVED